MRLTPHLGHHQHHQQTDLRRAYQWSIDRRDSKCSSRRSDRKILMDNAFFFFFCFVFFLVSSFFLVDSKIEPAFSKYLLFSGSAVSRGIPLAATVGDLPAAAKM